MKRRELENGEVAFCDGVYIVLNKKEDGSWKWEIDGLGFDGTIYCNGSQVSDIDEDGNTVAPFLEKED